MEALRSISDGGCTSVQIYCWVSHKIFLEISQIFDATVTKNYMAYFSGPLYIRYSVIISQTYIPNRSQMWTQNITAITKSKMQEPNNAKFYLSQLFLGLPALPLQLFRLSLLSLEFCRQLSHFLRQLYNLCHSGCVTTSPGRLHQLAVMKLLPCLSQFYLSLTQQLVQSTRLIPQFLTLQHTPIHHMR